MILSAFRARKGNLLGLQTNWAIPPPPLFADDPKGVHVEPGFSVVAAALEQNLQVGGGLAQVEIVAQLNPVRVAGEPFAGGNWAAGGHLAPLFIIIRFPKRKPIPNQPGTQFPPAEDAEAGAAP